MLWMMAKMGAMVSRFVTCIEHVVVVRCWPELPAACGESPFRGASHDPSLALSASLSIIANLSALPSPFCASLPCLKRRRYPRDLILHDQCSNPSVLLLVACKYTRWPIVRRTIECGTVDRTLQRKKKSNHTRHSICPVGHAESL